MALVKYFPAKDQENLIDAMKKEGREYLSAKVVNEKEASSGWGNKKVIVDLVVSVPGSNVLVKGVSSDEHASPRYEPLG